LPLGYRRLRGSSEVLPLSWDGPRRS